MFALMLATAYAEPRPVVAMMPLVPNDPTWLAISYC